MKSYLFGFELSALSKEFGADTVYEWVRDPSTTDFKKLEEFGEKSREDFGRPTEYEPEFAEQAGKLCLLGATDDELADFFKVHRSTIYRWKHIHDDFCDAIKSGKEKSDERVERSLYQKATGYNYTEQQAIKIKVEQHKEEVEVVEVERHAPADTTAAIFWLKNRRKNEWRDKHDHEVSGPNGGALEVVQRIERHIVRANTPDPNS